MDDHYFTTSHPHSNNPNSNQCAFTVTTPSSLTQSESGGAALHSPGSILAFASATTALSNSFNFNASTHHSLYQTEEKKPSNQINHQNHPYPPSAMLSPLSTHLGLGSPASTTGVSSDLEDDLQRKRANRLSLTSSIASSAPSTTASEVDGSENERDYDMNDSQYLNFCDGDQKGQYSPHQQQQQQQQHSGNGIMEGQDTEMKSIGRSRGGTLSDAFRFQNGDRVPDLVHSRSNATIQARYQNGDRSPLLSPSEGTSSHSNLAEFVFSDFIADAEPEASGGGGDDQDLQKTVDSAQALSLYSSPIQQQDHFVTPQRPLRHRDVSHLSAGESSSHFSSPMNHQNHHSSHAFLSCPTSPASPLSLLPQTSFETPITGSNQYNHQNNPNHAMGPNGAPSAAAVYATLHRPQFGNGGRSFSFNVIPDQQATSGLIHDPQGFFSDDRGVGSSGGNPGQVAHRGSEGGGNNFAAAGLGLFGYAQTRPDSLGRSHSLPGPMFNSEPLSCNPAHITPSSRSAYGTDRDHSVVSSPAGSLNVSSMVLIDSDGVESPNSPYGHSSHSSPNNFFDGGGSDAGLEDEEYEDDIEDRQNTIRSPPTKKQQLKGNGEFHETSSPSKSSNVRISAKRLFSSTREDEDRAMSILSSSAPSAPASIPSNSSVNRTPSNARSARGTRRSNGLTINSSRSKSPASHNGSPSSSFYNSSAQASPYLSPSNFNYAKIRSVSSSNLPRSPLAGTPASPAESVISAFSSRSSYHSGQEDNSNGPNLSSSLASASINSEGIITKRSRGRRVPDDPSELNNLGKMGKIYTCQVEGCGKCFKRSEHLKRHVRSIHTDEKPFECPYPTCHKKFSRLDNLNQHSRVHQVPSGSSSTGSVSARSSQAGSVSPAFSPSMPSSTSGNSQSSGGSGGGRRGSAPSSTSIRMAQSSSEGGGSQIKRKRGSASLNKDKSKSYKEEDEEPMFALDEEQEDSNSDVKPLSLRR